MLETNDIISEIQGFCRANNLAESTFGRLAVGNSKLMNRLRDGKGVTLKTARRIQEYINTHNGSNTTNPDRTGGSPKILNDEGRMERHREYEQPFRFFDNRQKYLAFVHTCNEKEMTAARITRELRNINPEPPALRLFDAGIGSGLVLSEVMRSMHNRFPTIPFYISGKEISDKNICSCLEKMPDRFCEHPATVLVLSNMRYNEAPALSPSDVWAAAALSWHEVPLSGNSSFDFANQIRDLEKTLKESWQTRRSEITENPVPIRPSVLILYRKDYKMLLDHLVPRPNDNTIKYELIIASHPWRARESATTKVKNILAPLTRSLSNGGRLLVTQAYGDDPGHEILLEEWPGEHPFTIRRHELIKILKDELGRESGLYNFNALSDNKSLFKYRMHTLPNEIDENLGTSTILAAWNAAIYVGQIDDDRLEAAMSRGSYLESTRRILKKYNDLWFNNESFVISKHGGQ